MTENLILHILEEKLREPIREAIVLELVTADEVASLLTKIIPEHVDRRNAHACVEAAFDSYHETTPELDRSQNVVLICPDDLGSTIL